MKKEDECRMDILDTRIMLIGESNYCMYSNAFFTAWKKIGYQNITYIKTNEVLDSKTSDTAIMRFWKRAERKTASGNHVYKLNKQILECAARIEPQLVFVYNSRYVFAQTLKRLKEKGAVVFLYSNDNPFADFYPNYYWRHFRKGLSIVDVGFAYRANNINDYKAAGCKWVCQLRSYYIEERNYRIDGLELDQDDPPVMFLGHNERDEREEYIRELVKRGIKVGLKAQDWENFEVGSPYVVKYENFEARYNELLNRTKIAIVFLSKINNDTYTRRCFEIPAAQTFMLAPYTEDLANMYEEDREIVFYRSKEEFVEKIFFYLAHAEERERIAQSGYERLMKSGHEAADRVKEVMKEYEKALERQ